MTKQELENEIEDMEIIGLMEDMNIHEPEKEENAKNEEQAEGIDDLIAKMEKVTIDKE